MARRMDKTAAKAAFEKYDADKNGYLTLDEFTKFMCEHFEKEAGEFIKGLIKDIFSLADGNGLFNRTNDKLNFSEFNKVIELIPEKFDGTAAMAIILYNLIDKDHSGTVSYKEMEAFFKKVAPEEAKDKAKLADVIKQIDENGDGKITLEEFLAIFV